MRADGLHLPGVRQPPAEVGGIDDLPPSKPLESQSGSARCFVFSTLEGTSYVSEDFSFLSFSVLYALRFLIAHFLLELFS